jgi:hypothetical protein
MKHRISLLLGGIVTAVLLSANPATAAVGTPAAAAPPVPGAVPGQTVDRPEETAPLGAGAFRAVTPERILDTRIGLGANQIPPNGSITLQVTGRAGVPLGGVLAVALNLTVTQPSTAGYLQAWASGSAPPRTSNLNFSAGATIANMAIVPVGPDGAIRMFVGTNGTSQVLADVAGYYAAGMPTDAGSYVPLAPTRLLDTRIGQGGSRVGPDATISAAIAGQGPVPASVSAVVLNVAVTQPAAPGFLQVWPGGAVAPDTSNLNFTSGQTVPNLVIVPVGPDGTVQFHNGSAGTVEVISDVVGYYLTGSASKSGAFAPVPPGRVLDTRTSLGAVGPVSAQGDITVQIAGRGGIPPTGASAAALNLTATDTLATGFVQAYPAGTSPPTGSSLNFTAGQTVPNLVLVPLSADGTITLHNGSAGTVQLVADVYGYVLG